MCGLRQMLAAAGGVQVYQLHQARDLSVLILAMVLMIDLPEHKLLETISLSSRYCSEQGLNPLTQSLHPLLAKSFWTWTLSRLVYSPFLDVSARSARYLLFALATSQSSAEFLQTPGPHPTHIAYSLAHLLMQMILDVFHVVWLSSKISSVALSAHT